jgi:hypothetical protein
VCVGDVAILGDVNAPRDDIPAANFSCAGYFRGASERQLSRLIAQICLQSGNAAGHPPEGHEAGHVTEATADDRKMADRLQPASFSLLTKLDFIG